MNEMTWTPGQPISPPAPLPILDRIGRLEEMNANLVSRVTAAEQKVDWLLERLVALLGAPMTPPPMAAEVDRRRMATGVGVQR